MTYLFRLFSSVQRGSKRGIGLRTATRLFYRLLAITKNQKKVPLPLKRTRKKSRPCSHKNTEKVSATCYWSMDLCDLNGRKGEMPCIPAHCHASSSFRALAGWVMSALEICGGVCLSAGDFLAPLTFLVHCSSPFPSVE